MNSQFFTDNRSRLYDAVRADLIVVTAYTATQATADMAAHFEQEANFWWLSGITEPNWQLVMSEGKSWLVQPKVDMVHALFDGSLPPEQALATSGADGILTQHEAEALLCEAADQGKSVATLGPDPHAKHYDFSLNSAPPALYQRLRRQFKEVTDCRQDLARLRAIKQPAELDAIRAAVSLTSEAFNELKGHLSSFTHEYEIEAFFTHYFRSRGAAGHAYEPIVASGSNACTLHYSTNNDPLPKNGLVLLDIGARAHGYAADITRTFALGTPTDRQRAVHTAVERAHTAIVELLRPGLEVASYLDGVDDIMKTELSGLGLLDSEKAYRRYFPHAVSHGLGVDVHDSLGAPKTFQAGMVLTVEPGIYIPEEGIGIRIEDDILITDTGHENLSGSLPTAL
jgi:Xaa-Pro aminopeptidase